MYHTSNTLNLGGLNYVNGESHPTANITIGRNRLKVYDHAKVYMRDGSSFEIELWNPKTVRVLAKIRINGKYVSSGGIVVNPGQRVYLERFIEADRKFRFSTYDVEDSEPAKRAIADNGLVQVDFYSEVETYQIPYQQNYWFPSGSDRYTLTNTGGVSFGGTTVNSVFSCSNSVGNTSITSDVSKVSFQNFNVNGSLETGRVEQGEKSEQTLEYTNGSFNSWTCAQASFKILPESARPVEAGEIRTYCPECRARVKKSSWKFCPSCGTSLID